MPCSLLSQRSLLLKRQRENQALKALIEKVRERFLAEAAAHPALYYEHDVGRVKSSTWIVERFILDNDNNADEALNCLKKAMKWRKDEKVMSYKPEYFPKEYFQAGYIITYGRDNHDGHVVVFRANIHRKVRDWAEVFKRFFTYHIEQVDILDDGKQGKFPSFYKSTNLFHPLGLTLLFDCQGIGLLNLDIDLLKTLVTAYSENYPKLFNSIVVHELPQILQHVFWLVLTWVPEEDKKLFHLTSGDQIYQFISQKQLPSFCAHGTNPKPWNTVPEGQIVPAEKFVLTPYGKQMELEAGDASDLDYLKPYIK